MAHYCSRLHEYIVGYTRVQRKDNMWLDLTHNVSLTICISTYSNASRFPRSIYCLHLAQVQNQWKYLCSMLRGRCLSHHKLNCAIVCLLIIPKIMSRIRNNICSHQCFFFFLSELHKLYAYQHLKYITLSLCTIVDNASTGSPLICISNFTSWLSLYLQRKDISADCFTGLHEHYQKAATTEKIIGEMSTRQVNIPY